MFLQYLRPLFKPFWDIYYKIIGVKMTKGMIEGDIKRVKGYGDQAKGKVGQAKGKVKAAQGQAQQAQGQAQKMQGQAQKLGAQAPQMPGGMAGQAGKAMPPQGQMPGMPPGMPQGNSQGAQMAGQQAGAPGALNPNPPIKLVGIFRRRKVCTQCSSELDKTWDSCPYCAQAAMAQAPSPAPAKTQAFMLDAGGGAAVQLLGWLVPVQGPQRGELFTLAPHSIIGTDPTACHIVLIDQYMSSKHAEIKAEGGVWVLRDMGSTNGTYVNDRRIDQHELVDNDFVKFGQALVKFKSL